MDDAALGSELTALYHDANDGFRRVLRFGARFLQIEASVTMETPGRDQAGQFKDSGGGMKGWLEAHAPQIARSTAYKYRDVTEALAKKYQIADPVLCFSAPASELPEAEAAQQAKALDFVAEKSIRQVQLELHLITAGNVDPNTGKRLHHPPKKDKRTPEQIAKENRAAAYGLFITALSSLKTALDDKQARRWLQPKDWQDLAKLSGDHHAALQKLADRATAATEGDRS